MSLTWVVNEADVGDQGVVMPANIAMVIAPITARVLAAFRDGGLKLGTPLLTASTPVSAVQPWANALRRAARGPGLSPNGLE